MPSQLKRLRESLKNAGVIGQPQKSKKAKKRARQNKSGNDARLSREAALESIREEFNPFEIKKTKEKFSVAGGRKVKGTVGKPSVSKQIGEENRRKTLLVEMQQRNKVGGIIDRRFGENDPTINPEDKMLERFTREQQKKSYKSDIFNLEDDDEVLTHYGQSLGSLPNDDFREDMDGSDDDLLRPAKRTHPLDGELQSDEDDNGGPPKKKSKAEVMKEVIMKSKYHKYERQKEKEADEDLRDELDAELGDIRALLAGIPVRPPPGKPAVTDAGVDGSLHADRAAQINSGLNVDSKYDALVREMTYDKRSKPADRTKSAEELAEDRAKQLQKLERSRQKRMQGEESSDEEPEEEEEVPSDDEFKLGKGIRLAADEKEFVHGDSGSEDQSSESEEESDEEVEEEEEDIEASGSRPSRRRDLDNDDAYSDDYQSDEDPDALASDEEASESEDEAEEDGLMESEDESPAAKPTDDGKVVVNGDSSLPFTFPCPQTHQEFLKATSKYKVEDLPTIVKRIRVLHHPSLAAGNKEKLSHFMVVVFDHIIYLADSPSFPPMDVLDILLRHLHSLSKEFPQASAAKFRDYLQKFFDRIGLQRKTKRSDLIILTALSIIYPTSDHFHIVVTPAMLVIARWLGSNAPTDIEKLVHGCYMVTLCLQYQRLSKRVIPEALNFVYQSLLVLSPTSPTKVSGGFPVHGIENISKLRISSSSKDKFELGKLKFKEALYPGSVSNTAALQITLAYAFTQQLLALARLYSSKAALLELTNPAVSILSHFTSPACIKSLPKTFTTYVKETAFPELERIRSHSQKFRRPLELHHHRPLPIPSNYPKFDEEYSLDRHKGSYDADRDRKELSKLKAEHKKERKGAMRELRKDSQFIAREKLKERKVADQEYHDKMKRIVNMIQNEEGAATNAYERERSGRKKSKK
ncbi:nucleolar complex protein 14 [Orbilia oligospora]|uniref:Nucleolar complex protein 14 n=1 Tax=Orbilia oligospora TaxID=2813651 RepID=A0A7C8J3U0_ORBOL|nr:nucleolar complex protein 14 [Orbilia oligospora]KAF3087468.1 nucleolar complex protein 14 [Orbilia oligospora]KAF3136485.1 nucleolar complex protein 14 [Orbilia oligospora]KAF3152978.1 nucleolar complex protein 14 [Orbilia oligospora]